MQCLIDEIFLAFLHDFQVQTVISCVSMLRRFNMHEISFLFNFQVHCGDVRRPGRRDPRQRVGGGPQEAVQAAVQVRKRFPQPVPVLADPIGRAQR